EVALPSETRREGYSPEAVRPCSSFFFAAQCTTLYSFRHVLMSRLRKPNFISRFFGALGPGLITGAADDAPSGIATYSIAGSQLGTSLLVTAVLTSPVI